MNASSDSVHSQTEATTSRPLSKNVDPNLLPGTEHPDGSHFPIAPARMVRVVPDGFRARRMPCLVRLRFPTRGARASPVIDERSAQKSLRGSTAAVRDRIGLQPSVEGFPPGSREIAQVAACSSNWAWVANDAPQAHVKEVGIVSEKSPTRFQRFDRASLQGNPKRTDSPVASCAEESQNGRPRSRCGLPTIFFGSTIRSNSSAVTNPLRSAASRRGRFSSVAM